MPYRKYNLIKMESNQLHKREPMYSIKVNIFKLKRKKERRTRISFGDKTTSVVNVLCKF